MLSKRSLDNVWTATDGSGWKKLKLALFGRCPFFLAHLSGVRGEDIRVGGSCNPHLQGR